MPTDEKSLRKDIENLVRKTVEETPDALLDEEAPGLVGAERYEGDGGPGGLPQRPVRQKARHWSRKGRNKCVRMLGALGEVFPGARRRHCAVISTATCWEGFP